ncbi:hypothetical protein OsJ_21188 [Oryza sativa Japonica Group]|uniref:Cytochrome P450 n=1 Tax=Oryza sativa subsp. japonica TaxID=39947 RepID=A3BBA8_ORYSJ|nr:hypothetical protein OsJ_21188 [Oryza sativa Japonica Group]
MEDWIFYSLTLLLCLACSLLLRARASAAAVEVAPLPPGPRTVPVLGPLLFLARRDFDVEPTLRRIAAEHGPVFTFAPLGPSRPTIFVAARGPAHRALVQRGAAFASRPRGVSPASVLLTSGGRNGGAPLTVVEPFQYAMFCLLVYMCFGDRPGDARVREIEALQRELLSNFLSFEVFAFLPPITRLVFRRRWNKLVSLRRRQEELFAPLIRARREAGAGGDCYVDSLVKLTIPEDGGRGLTDVEIVSLCSEFMSAGTDTTATALQWILANLVKNPAMQDKLREEITAAAVDGEVREEDLQAMPYLKAVVLEGLRRHPPDHFLLPHTVEEETTLDGYRVPANTPVNFAVGEIGLDSEVWTSPEVFRPERFLAGGEGEDVDLTGSKEIKMMPFGAGRRICPGMALALLHLEYFVANLVREFEWREVAGDEVDLTQKLQFTVVMKRPLKATAVPLRGDRSAAAAVTGSA